jgi:hypothetical protein
MSASVPALIRFPEESGRQESWGRLLELSPSSATIETRAALAPAERFTLGFEIAQGPFDADARVLHCWRDQDGYWVAHVRFSDERQRRALAVHLADVLSRAV